MSDLKERPVPKAERSELPAFPRGERAWARCSGCTDYFASGVDADGLCWECRL